VRIIHQDLINNFKQQQQKEQELICAENSVSGTILSSLHALSHLILQQKNEEGIGIMPILKTQTLSIEEVQ